MEYELQKKESIWVCGLRTDLSTSQKENFRIIRTHWQNFNNELRIRKLTQGEDWKKYGITQKINDRYFYLAAIPLEIEINGFETVEIAGGQFARFRHIGKMELITKTIYDTYKRVIPESYLIIAQMRYPICP